MNSLRNSIGMEFVRIDPGSFMMGAESTLLPDSLSGMTHRSFGGFDEQPRHEVTITQPFFLQVTQVTNAQYERFDPSHAELRGKLGFSTADHEAVVFVSWSEAAAFCLWLSRQEGVVCRLPTEAEWEYACRAGTTTPFSTGLTLPEPFLKNARRSRFPDPRRTIPEDHVDLTVGSTPANPWGLHDMHGNVEEWCADWYGPYPEEPQIDPTGPTDGQFRVTRGGSHSTEPYYLRSSCRMGSLPQDRSWLIGFRVAMGNPPAGAASPASLPALHARRVRQTHSPRRKQEGHLRPFSAPRPYVKIPSTTWGPIYPAHNHDPAITQCPNGDLLAVWYSCMSEAESDRELFLAASRLRFGAREWDDASAFWGAPGRNNHAPALGFDGEQTIYHFAGLSAAASWSNLAIVMRTSTDSGATWSRARLIQSEHGPDNMPAGTLVVTRDGALLLPVDTPEGTQLLVSEDRGESWRRAAGTTRGIHAGVVELANGDLLALARGGAIHGSMPQSISSDRGETWHSTASPFPAIQGGQRPTLLRLREGAILLASFSNNRSLSLTLPSGEHKPASGLFVALSLDEGATWPVRRLVPALPDAGSGRGGFLLTTTNRPPFYADDEHGEPVGYLAAVQAFDGRIHLITSRNHYSFTLSWVL